MPQRDLVNRRRLQVLCALLALAVPGATSGRAEETPAAPVASATGRPTYTVPRAAAAPKIDGQLDDALWQAPPLVPLAYEVRPGENTPAPVQTDVWIAYDDHHLYFAFRAADPNPKAIRARYSDRDRAFQDDFVGVVLDTFDDERRGFEFFVNPLGVQMDLMQNEITGIEDETWDAIWYSAGRLTAGGYEVEMAIPFSALRFLDGGRVQTWGLDALRVYPRDSRYQFTSTPRVRGKNCYLCQAAKITGMQGISPGRDIEFDPTVIASRTDARRDPPSGPMEDGGIDTEAGISARWGVTPNLTLNAAINPDFSQVEADAAQLSINTQFAIFYPEKRPFFLEGADLFSTKLGVVYTRNIADPSWGLKLTGKSGAHAIGAIASRDAVTNVLVPGSEFSDFGSIDTANTSGIARYRHDVGRASTIGVLFTGRRGDGYQNGLGGIDALFRWQERYALRVEAFGSQTEYPREFATTFGQPNGSFADHAVRLGFSRQTRDWYLSGVLLDVGEGFRADLGFVPQVGVRQAESYLEHQWYGEKGDPYTQLTLGAHLNQIERREGRDLLVRQVEAYGFYQGPWQSFAELHVNAGRRGIDSRVFDDNYIYFYGEAKPTGLLSLYFEGRAGDQVDFANARQGQGLRLSPSVRLEPGRHLRLQLSHTYATLDAHGGRVFTARVTELRTTYQFSLRTFARLVTQHFSVDRDPALYEATVDRRSQDLTNQLLFAYKVNPQTVLFLGYSDSSLADDRVDLTRQSRTLFFKLGYAWQL